MVCLLGVKAGRACFQGADVRFKGYLVHHVSSCIF